MLQSTFKNERPFMGGGGGTPAQTLKFGCTYSTAEPYQKSGLPDLLTNYRLE